MGDVLSVATEPVEQRNLSDVIQDEYRRLFQFIRTRVDDQGDAEDILQDVFYELIEAYRLMQPIEQVGAWLYRVARNRIIDRFRKQSRGAGNENRAVTEEDDSFQLEDLLPSRDAGPEAEYARNVLFE